MSTFAVLNKVLGLQLFLLFGVWFHWSVAQADSKRRSKILLVCPFKNSYLPRNQTHSYCCICSIRVTVGSEFQIIFGTVWIPGGKIIYMEKCIGSVTMSGWIPKLLLPSGPSPYTSLKIAIIQYGSFKKKLFLTNTYSICGITLQCSHGRMLKTELFLWPLLGGGHNKP